MTTRAYTSPQAFKQALEQRLRSASKGGADFARRRQLLVFDRFLARIVAVLGNAVLLKGGLVLELRLERARTTKDVDLRLTGTPEGVLARLQDAGRKELGDFMAFEIDPDAEHPTIQNDGMQYEGLRFRAECRLAGRLYGQRFGVDVAFGDPILGEPEVVTAADVLAFAGIPPPVLRLYPIETHIAEKLHAYTMPRARANTRVKDLPDMALLATTGPLEAWRLRAALERTFEFRATHPLPSSLPDPPANWSTPYVEMARENELAWTTLEQLTAAVGTFLDPVLAGNGGIWRPAAWAWDSALLATIVPKVE
ncbi:MAG: nucleotidyl transferase AbiEii/AbiGii toxin family protein [Gammaproteobacteria bacterium]